MSIQIFSTENDGKCLTKPTMSFDQPHVLKREKSILPLELVTESKKQPQTQKPDILHTLTIKTRQTTPCHRYLLVGLTFICKQYTAPKLLHYCINNHLMAKRI